MRDRFSTDIRRNGSRNASTPYGLMSAAASAARANVAHARTAMRRAPTGALRYRLERERPDQQKAEDEAAMHVRPGSHQRDEPERRWTATSARSDEAGAPSGYEREGQHMRPREQARGHERQADRDGRDERRAANLARNGQAHDQRRNRSGSASQQRDATPSAEAEGERQQNFRQPFMRRPRRACHRITERVDARRGPLSDDPFARCHMRPGVAVAEHMGREGGESK